MIYTTSYIFRAFIACLKGAKGAYDGSDEDDKVSQKELECGVQADANANGKIDKEEIAAFEKCLGLDYPAKGKKGGKQSGMNGYDQDGDGKISPAEEQCGKQFDANKNGVIDKVKYIHWYIHTEMKQTMFPNQYVFL